MKGVTIQINSLEAIERLIGGDTEAEITIRNSVVQKFANSYLKSIAVEYGKTGIANSFKKQVTEEIFKKSYGFGDIVMTDRYKRFLIKEIDDIFKSKIATQVETFLISERLEMIVNNSIDRKVKLAVSAITNNIIEEKAKELIKKRMKL